MAKLQRRHIIAVTIGNALEFYDFVVYALFSIQIGHAFFPAQSSYTSLMLSLATFGAGFLTRPLGAIVIGNYSDRAGRRPAMMLCFVLIGCAIVGMAVIPPYAKIGIAAPILALIARMVQGFSLGGEIGSNTAYLMEASAPDRRGLIVSFQGASQNLAYVAGGIVGSLLTWLLPAAMVDAYAWRIAFLLGAAAVPFGLWLRNNLPETLHAGAASEPEQPRLRLAYTYRRVLAVAMIVNSCGTIANYIFAYMVTYAQNTLHMAERAGFLAEIAGYALSTPATVLGGWLSDRYGRRPINLWGNFLFLVLIYPVFHWIDTSRTDFALIAGTAILNVPANLIWGGFYAGVTEILPQSIRGASFGITYSLAVAIFGGTTQLVVTWLIHTTGSALAPAWYMVGVTAVSQVALLCMPESAPRRARIPLNEKGV